MDPIFLLNGLSNLGIALLTFFLFYTLYYHGKQIRTIIQILAAYGIFNAIVGVTHLLWFTGYLAPTSNDFVLIYATLIILTTTLLLYMVYQITHTRNLVYLFVLYIVSLFSINLTLSSFFYVTLLISFLLLLMVFIELVFFKNLYLKLAGKLGVAYVLISLLFLYLIYNHFSAQRLFWFLPNVMMLLLLYFIGRDMTEHGVFDDEHLKPKRQHILAVFSKFMIFIVAISFFTFVSSLAVHEFGHAIVGQYYGCEQSRAIIYDILNAPHAELVCSGPINELFLSLGGLIATLIVGLVFLLAGDSFTLRLSNLIFGFSFILIYADMLSIGFSPTIATSFTLLGFVIVSIAVVRLSLYYLQQEHIFGPSMAHRPVPLDKTKITIYKPKQKHIKKRRYKNAPR